MMFPTFQEAKSSRVLIVLFISVLGGKDSCQYVVPLVFVPGCTNVFVGSVSMYLELSNS
jgi:hypothetical protein